MSLNPLLRNSCAHALYTLGDSVPSLLYVTDKDGNCRFVNHRWVEFTGLSEVESLENRWMEVVHPADRPALKRSIDESVSAHRGTTGEIRLRRADGEYRQVNMISAPLFDEDGDFLGFVGTITDETARRRLAAKLEETSERLHAVVEAIPEAAVLKDSEGRWQTANAEALRLFDLEDVDWQNRTDRQLAQLKPRGAEMFESLQLADEHAWQSAGRYNSVDLLRDHAGLPMYLTATRVPLFRENGQRRALLTLLGKPFQGRLGNPDSLQLAALAFEQSSDGIMVTDAQQRILRVNRAFTEITGYLPEEVLGRTPHMLSSGRHDRAFYAAMWSSLQSSRSWKGEIWNRRKNGELYPEWLSITAIADATGRIRQYVGAFSDVAEKKRIEEERRRHALYDGLTGLGNRTLVGERIAHHLETGGRVAFLLFNPSRFSQVNFLFGSSFGDAVLQVIARTLKETMGRRGTVGRWAGDQFALVVSLAEDSEAAQRTISELLQNLRAAFAAPIMVEGRPVRLRFSLGIAMAPDDGTESAALIRNAESAASNARVAEPGTYCFHTPEMEERVRLRLSLEEDLMPALDAGELTLAYQPILDLSTARVSGVEALLRWNHPRRGQVPPPAFIKVAEECGFIAAIGRFVLRQACAQLRQWIDAGLSIRRVAVNVSAVELLNPDFEPFVREVLSASALSPEMLELEITESVFIHEDSPVVELLRSLRAFGVRLAIDDFGMRFSTLSYLNRLPVDTLKLDRSFVTGLPSDSGSISLTRAILVLAQNLGLEVVAEGVESAAQAVFLAENGCRRMQGFHLSSPVPGNAIPAVVRRIEQG